MVSIKSHLLTDPVKQNLSAVASGGLVSGLEGQLVGWLVGGLVGSIASWVDMVGWLDGRLG